MLDIRKLSAIQQEIIHDIKDEGAGIVAYEDRYPSFEGNPTCVRRARAGVADAPWYLPFYW